MSYIKMDDCAEALSRFVGEYFSDSVRLRSADGFFEGDAVYIDGEYTAYMFRCVLSALVGGGRISVALSQMNDSFTVSFSTESKLGEPDAALLERLAEAARLAGFSMSVCGGAITFSAHLERGKLVISVLCGDDFYDILSRVFFENDLSGTAVDE